MNSKEKVLKTITKEYQSTGKISYLAGVNYYETHNVLKQLEKQRVIENMKKGLTYNFWRLK